MLDFFIQVIHANEYKLCVFELRFEKKAIKEKIINND